MCKTFSAKSTCTLVVPFLHFAFAGVRCPTTFVANEELWKKIRCSSVRGQSSIGYSRTSHFIAKKIKRRLHQNLFNSKMSFFRNFIFPCMSHRICCSLAERDLYKWLSLLSGCRLMDSNWQLLILFCALTSNYSLRQLMLKRKRISVFT